MRDVESEKELYFGKLSQLDQFMSDASSQHEVQQNPLVCHYLQEINNILFQEGLGGSTPFGQKPFTPSIIAAMQTDTIQASVAEHHTESLLDDQNVEMN